MTTLARARRLWAMLRPPETRLLERAAGEREISVNRLVAGVLVLAYVAVLATLGLHSWSLTSVSIGYLAAGGAVFVDVRLRPHRSPRRRYACLYLDIGGVSFVLSQFMPYTLPLFAAYTWITLGYAFRYGIAYLRASSVLSLVGFSMVVATTPSWSAQPFLVAAIGGSLAIIPAYVEALLRQALGALERERASNRATAFVLACISHDLRTPLGAMIAVTDLLSDTVLSPQQRAMLATVRASARSILTDIDHLVEVSRIEADHLDVAKTEFALLPLLHEVMGLADAAARAKGVHLALYVSADTPLVIETDRRHLGKVALNLIHAAVEAGSAGSVSVTVDGGMLGRRPPHLRVAVAVAGTNPSPHAAAKPSEVHSESDREPLVWCRPPGLGLSVAKHLVGLLGGRVGVEDDPDAGTTYRVEIPIQARRQPRPDLAGAGIVLLSREPVWTQALAARLERLGAETFVVDRIDRLADVLAHARGDLRTLAVAIDGRGVDPAAAALAIHRDPMFERVPLILFAAARGLPRPHVRRYYATAIDDTSSDDELWTALRVVGSPDAEKGNAMPVPSNIDPGAPPVADSPQVLVADASRTGQVLLTQWLTQAGYGVRVVADGDAALDALAGETFDLALVDLDGPGMDGLDAVLLHRFTELSGKRNRLPVVGMVAEAGAQAARDRAGPALDACLTKPLDRTRLLEAVAGLARVRAPMPPPDEAAIGPGVTPISSHPHFRAGLGPPPPGEFDRLAADAGAGDLGRIADAFRDDADAALARLATAVRAGDVGGFRAQLDALGTSAGAISAARVEALCRSGTTIQADALPDRGKALVAQLAQEVRRVCGDLEGRC